jgi:putative Holliday junction resolvase
MPRVLAIDYGQKHTGIAVTDEMQIIASGLTTIPVPFLLKIISLRRGRSGSY